MSQHALQRDSISEFPLVRGGKSTSDSCSINSNQFVLTICRLIWNQTKFRMMLNQSEKHNYNPNMVLINRIDKVFLSVSMLCNTIFNHFRFHTKRTHFYTYIMYIFVCIFNENIFMFACGDAL